MRKKTEMSGSPASSLYLSFSVAKCVEPLDEEDDDADGQLPVGILLLVG
jgi:hypothetical protein